MKHKRRDDLPKPPSLAANDFLGELFRELIDGNKVSPWLDDAVLNI